MNLASVEESSESDSDTLEGDFHLISVDIS